MGFYSCFPDSEIRNSGQLHKFIPELRPLISKCPFPEPCIYSCPEFDNFRPNVLSRDSWKEFGGSESRSFIKNVKYWFVIDVHDINDNTIVKLNILRSYSNSKPCRSLPNPLARVTALWQFLECFQRFCCGLLWMGSFDKVIELLCSRMKGLPFQLR